MKPGAPPRLLDDPEAVPGLRKDLRRVAAAPSSYDVAAGLASLRATVGPAAPAGGGESGASASSGSGAASSGAASSGAAAVALGGKAVLAVLGVAALVAGSVALVRVGPSRQRAERSQAPSAERAVPAARVAPGEAEPREHAPEPVASAQVAAAQDRVAHVPTGVPTAPHDPDGKLRREIAQLARIKTLLPRDPRAAYRLAHSGNREFARGVLVQEREGLAVLALAALGDARAARDARAFLTRYPDSPLRERVAAIAAGSAGGER